MSNLNKFRIDCEWQKLLSKLADEFLDISPLLIIAERHSLAMAARTSRATDSMQVAFRLCRETEVEDCLNCRDVESTSNQVCRNQEVDVPALELFYIVETLFLSQITMNLDRLEAEESKERVKTSALLLLIDEDDDTLTETFQS